MTLKQRVGHPTSLTMGGETQRLYLALAVTLVTAFVIAGGARDDLLSLLLWRPLSMLVAVCAITLFWGRAVLTGKAVLLLGLAVIALPAMQLVPMPPALWTALPGREFLVAIYRDAGMALPWQPISVAQARTWNALFALAAPFGVLILALSLDQAGHRKLLSVLLGLGFASGIIGMLQALGPVDGTFYFYRITNRGLSVGLFANRNHQAAFLAAMLPLLAAHLSMFRGKPEELFFQRTVTLAAGGLLIPLILMTGSRGGAILALLGLGAAWWVYRAPSATVRSAERQAELRKRLIGFVLLAALIAFAVLAAFRTPAVQRILESDPAGELRFSAFPTVVEAVGRFFPVGSGLGTFVEVYQIFEPDALIDAAYFNHAHNDYVELLLTGGIVGAILLAWAICLGLVSAISLIRNRRMSQDDRGYSAQVLGRAGFSVLTMLALYSAADYPLRVPSLMLLAVIATAWCSIAYKAARG